MDPEAGIVSTLLLVSAVWFTIACGAEKDGWTPLHRAGGEGHEAVVRYLVSQGANIEARNRVSDADVVQLMTDNGEADANGVERYLVLMRE